MNSIVNEIVLYPKLNSVSMDINEFAVQKKTSLVKCDCLLPDRTVKLSPKIDKLLHLKLT